MNTESKKYTDREERLNAWSHYIGIAFSCAGIVRLLCCRQPQLSLLALAAALFYGASLLFMFGASSFYHTSKTPSRRALGRHLDHIAVYFLIIGSYAPLLYVTSRNWIGAVVFTFLLLGGITGGTARLLNFRHIKKLEITLYVIMGWCCVFIAGKFIRILPSGLLYLLLAGGISYTAGLAAYLNRREFSHLIWHFFVLAGATLQFFAISGALDL